MIRRILAVAAVLFLGAVPAQAADPASPVVALGKLEARLFYYQSGRLSDDLLAREEPFVGWNTVIGEGGADEAANDLLVVIGVSADGETFSDRPIELWVSDEDGKVLARRRFGSVLTGNNGAAKLPLWLNDVGCAGEITMRAKMGGEERTATLGLHCGE
jgi:hypothetical protein